MTTKKHEQLGLSEVKSFSSLGIKSGQLRWQITANGLVNKQFVIFDAELIELEKGPGYVCNILLDDKEVLALLQGVVINDQIEQIGDRFPVEVTLVKQGKTNILT